ncbi:MAG TPA: oleate hydratase [Burkholderiaceae bacterium]|nr:oleate hydratase [Burkholderiaceae bacterium]
MKQARPDRQAYLVGGGIASLAAAVYLVRDGGFPGDHVHIIEEADLGGSLDAAGSAPQGYSMRGSRMYGPAYVLMYELLSRVPSLDDPAKSVTQDTLEFWAQSPWDDKARLVEQRHVVDAASFGLSNKDRVDLIALMLRSEEALGAKRIEECFDAHFLASNFWFMWSSVFGFETWHSAAELRRYLLRFLRLFPELVSLKIVQSTRYNARDSIVRPLVRWLEQQGVRFDIGMQVTDLDFEILGDSRKAVRCIRARRDAAVAEIEVATEDFVIVTLGSMTADSSVGSMTSPPAGPVRRSGAWPLWQRLAAKDATFGRPAVFCGDVERTKWVTFTVTHADDRFVRRVERFTGSPAGQGGLVTLKDSSWRLTFHVYHPPAYAGQPPGTHVWWGYGLFAERPGDFVKKTMTACSGAEILTELISHLGWQDELAALLDGANCVPCLLPYTTSQFMPRAPGDRPPVVPPGTANLAFVGQYCEIPDNVVYTVEYSVQSAALAVATLLGVPQVVPPAYKGLEHPNALIGAIRRILE